MIMVIICNCGVIMSITVYSKPKCVQCDATIKALDVIGSSYRVVDVSSDTNAFESIKSMGYRQVPVVVTGEQHWSGFRPDMIKKLK